MNINDENNRGAIAWMAKNHVAANLLMVFLLLGGIFSAFRIKQEVFPEFELDTITVSVSYPGASPEEVEKAIVESIEENVRGIDDVDRVLSTAAEGSGTVTIELLLGADPDEALQDIRNAVDRITTFPEEAEQPQVQLASRRHDVMSLILYGDMDDRALRELAEQARDELLQRENITLVELDSVKPYEISIEVSEDMLRSYGLTLREIASQISTEAVEIPAGGVKTSGGEILLRVSERRDWGKEFGDLPIISKSDGTRVRLGDIATIKDGFSDVDLEAYYNGKPAVEIEVFRVGDQTPIEVAASAREFVDEFRKRLPEGAGIQVLSDHSDIYKDRINLLLRNAYIGLSLVMILLGLFLEIRLAFWVMMGLPISFLGAILFLPGMDVSVNMVSLFAFIMALGMVVDDAIVVGENVYKNRQKGMPFLRAAIDGVREVSVPVTFSILTNIAAFTPLLFVPGTMGKFFKVIPIVVISVFTISLVEALFILPAHLGHMRKREPRGVFRAISLVQRRISRGLETFIEKYYQPLVRLALRNRYITVSIAVMILLIVLSVVQSGRIGIVPRPKVEADRVRVDVQLPFGSPIDETRRVEEKLLAAAQKVVARHGGDDILKGIFSRVGGSSSGSAHLAQVRVNLVTEDQREVSATQIAREWREEVGDLTGVEKLTFDYDLGGGGRGKAINIDLSHRDRNVLKLASAELAAELDGYAATNQVDDGFEEGKSQYSLKGKPAGESVGLTRYSIASQLRAAFYGAEALRQQRGRNEVKVMVRLPEEERRSIHDIEEFLLTTPSGGHMPLKEAAEVEKGRAYTVINRTNGRRVVSVSADVDPPSLATQILDDMRDKVLPAMMRKYPGLSYSLEGQRRDYNTSMAGLRSGFILAIAAIYIMLAIPFKSYAQPLIVMISIPFGMVGAVLGHMLMGYDLSLISMMGIVALSGVVVNDSLILVDYLNGLRREGVGALDAAAQAGMRRFRPIMLTSLTTFFGLAPMIFERSIQAKFLIPMAISLGYGILFATLIALLLVPALYMIIEDVLQLFARLRRGTGEPAGTDTTPSQKTAEGEPAP